MRWRISSTGAPTSVPPQHLGNYLRDFDELIKQAKSKTVLYMTWARSHTPEAQQGISWMQDRHFKDVSFLPFKSRPSGFAFQTSLGDGLIGMAEEGMHALKNVADGINATLSPEMGVLMITHYQRMLNYVKPQFVHVLLDGRVVMSGGEELSHQLEANGYDWVREQVGLPAGVGVAPGVTLVRDGSSRRVGFDRSPASA